LPTNSTLAAETRTFAPPSIRAASVVNRTAPPGASAVTVAAPSMRPWNSMRSVARIRRTPSPSTRSETITTFARSLVASTTARPDTRPIFSTPISPVSATASRSMASGKTYSPFGLFKAMTPSAGSATGSTGTAGATATRGGGATSGPRAATNNPGGGATSNRAAECCFGSGAGGLDGSSTADSGSSATGHRT